VKVEPILFLAASGRGRRLADWWKGLTPLFCCVLAHTDTCLLPGVSAAGATEELRIYTPAADAEAVAYGLPRCLPRLPSNPLGPPGPAGITRAAVRLGRLPVEFVAAGLRVAPEVDHRVVPCSGGRRIDCGDAVPEARELFRAGIALGREMAAAHPYVVLGESVPGGTTTALALLLALGIAACGRVSGSVPGNAHATKERVARAALRAAGLGEGDGRADPLGAAGQVGDPMLPLAAGFVGGAAATGTDVLLAGGSQMLAVAALVRATLGEGALERVAVGTTRWVALDPAADVPGLAADVDPRLPLLAVNLNFARSRHASLRAYEQFFVKEGVGAGGACIAALLATGVELAELHEAIDAAYDPLRAPTEVGALPHPPPARD
jgi:uncharacterized protein (TIGR00303 family)